MSHSRCKRGRQINKAERKELNTKKRLEESLYKRIQRLLFICKYCHLMYNRQIGKIVYGLFHQARQEVCLCILKLAVIPGSPLITLNTEREITFFPFEQACFCHWCPFRYFQQYIMFLLLTS